MITIARVLGQAGISFLFLGWICRISSRVFFYCCGIRLSFPFFRLLLFFASCMAAEFSLEILDSFFLGGRIWGKGGGLTDQHLPGLYGYGYYSVTQSIYLSSITTTNHPHLLGRHNYINYYGV